MNVTRHTQLRIGAINTLIRQIASLDRRFYSSDQDLRDTVHSPKVYSKFYLVDYDLWFSCAKCQKSWKAVKGSLQKNNCNGHTLNSQLEAFRDFILTGLPIRIYSDYWAYSFESLLIVHRLAKELGICLSENFRCYEYSDDGGKEHIHTEGDVDGY